MANLRFRVIASAGDQVLSSVSNAVILFAMAGPSSVESFGAAVLVFSLITAAIGLVRGALGTPLLLMSAKPHDEVVREASRAVSAAVVFGLGVGVVAFVLSEVLREPNIGLAYAVAVPIVLAQDVLRFTAMALGQPERAFIADAVWAVGAGLVLVITWIDKSALTIAEMIWWWAAAGLLALAYLVRHFHIRPSFDGLHDWWVTHWRHRVRFGFESGIDQLSAIIVVSISTAFIGTVAAASLRGAVTVLGPFAVLISSLPLIVIPEAIRAGHSDRQVWSTLRYAAWITSSLAIIIGFLAPFVPVEIGRLLLGDSWIVATEVLPFLGLEYAAICWIAAAYNFHRSKGAAKKLLNLRIVQSLLAIVICTVAAAATRTAVGVSIGLALSSTLMAIGLVISVQRLMWTERRRHLDAKAASSDETSADETSTDETSTDETSTDQTSTDETSTDETSTDSGELTSADIAVVDQVEVPEAVLLLADSDLDSIAHHPQVVESDDRDGRDKTLVGQPR